MSISGQITKIRQDLPERVKLVCVSKFHPDEAILEAYESGERVFGESKVQELTGKHERLPKDIEWHFIGHLQTNKVKFLVPFVSLIHGVDSLKLLNEIDKQAKKADKTVSCLLQVHIAEESTKFGFSPSEMKDIFKEGRLKEFENIRLLGLMGMATFTDNTEQVRKEFRTLKTLLTDIQSDFSMEYPCFGEISMGMSDDYKIAIEEGSTLVRIGSTIFGHRNYGSFE